MFLRMHRSKKLLPGVRLNMSKSGPSVSVGVKGARVNFGSGGVRTTLGVPGSGLSVIDQRSWSRAGGKVVMEGLQPPNTLRGAAQPPAWKMAVAKTLAWVLVAIPALLLLLVGLALMAFGAVVIVALVRGG